MPGALQIRAQLHSGSSSGSPSASKTTVWSLQRQGSKPAEESLTCRKLSSSQHFFGVSEAVFNMQVVRQCSACASRTHLLNQSDISLLRADRNIIRRGAARISLRRYVTTYISIFVQLKHCKLTNADSYYYLPAVRRESCSVAASILRDGETPSRQDIWAVGLMTSLSHRWVHFFCGRWEKKIQATN